MGICSSDIAKQQIVGGCETNDCDMTTFKISGKDELGQSLVISSKQLNIEDDPNKQYLALYYEKHKNDIDPKFTKLYLDVLKQEAPPSFLEINLKSYEISKQQAKYLTCLLQYCPNILKLNL